MKRVLSLGTFKRPRKKRLYPWRTRPGIAAAGLTAAFIR